MPGPAELPALWTLTQRVADAVGPDFLPSPCQLMRVPTGWVGALCICSVRAHGFTQVAMAQPLLVPLLPVWVLAFHYFSSQEVGVGVHVSSVLCPLLQESWMPLGRKPE